MKRVLMISKSVFILFTIMLTSCAKDGDIGPQGEMGLQGEQGEQGPQGETGDVGETGTANVMYSDWLDQDFNFTDLPRAKSMKVDELRLTQDFLNNGGIVLGFYRNRNAVYPLPTTFDQNSFAIRREFIAFHFDDRGEVRFNIISTDDSDLTELELTGSSIAEPQYKYVMIPGGVNLTGRSLQPNFKKMTYEEIIKYFSLEY